MICNVILSYRDKWSQKNDPLEYYVSTREYPDDKYPGAEKAARLAKVEACRRIRLGEGFRVGVSQLRTVLVFNGPVVIEKWWFDET